MYLCIKSVAIFFVNFNVPSFFIFISWYKTVPPAGRPLITAVTADRTSQDSRHILAIWAASAESWSLVIGYWSRNISFFCLSETCNYSGSENFFGQIAQLCKYVITNLQKKKNHPLVLPLVCYMHLWTFWERKSEIKCFYLVR